MKRAWPGCALALMLAGPVAAAGSPPPEQTAFAANLEVGDVPTASTLFARMFHLNVRMYEGGGILAKAAASFNNSLMLGLGVNADNVIGSGRVNFSDNPVQAVAKVKLFDPPGGRTAVALGYDGNAYDATRQRGVYGVLSEQVGGAGLVARIHAGAGVLRFRNFAATRKTDPGPDVNAFLGVSAALSEDVFLGAEWDDALWHDGSLNASIGYSWDVGLRLQLDFKDLVRKSSPSNRLLKILYTF